MKWFKDISTLEELRKRYKQLVIKYHPDNGGQEEALKEINSEYDLLFKKLKSGYENSENYKNATDRQKQTYDSVKDRMLREMIIKLCRYPGLIIELCGVWIYVFGTTKTYKDELKALGLHYASKKKCWYIHFDDYVKHGKKQASMSYIRNKYGSVIVHAEDKNHVTAKA